MAVVVMVLGCLLLTTPPTPVSAVTVLSLIETDGPMLLMLGGNTTTTDINGTETDVENLQVENREDRRGWETGTGGAIPFPIAGVLRGSDLALWQANFVKAQLEALGVEVILKIIKILINLY